jgi:hypothetical protein
MSGERFTRLLHCRQQYDQIAMIAMTTSSR